MVKTDWIVSRAKDLLMPLLVVGVVVLGILGYSYYRCVQYNVPQYSEQLSASARKHAEAISEYLLKQEKNSALLAQAPEVAGMVARFAEAKKVDASEEFMAFVKERVDTFGYKNLLLVDTKGDVLFALSQEKLLDINLFDRPYNKSELARSFFRVTMSMTPDVSAYAFDPIINQPALYLSVPLFKDNSLFGILAVQLDQEKLIAPLQNYLGMGTTGEIVLGKRTSLGTQIIIPTRNDPDSAFKRPLRLRPDAPFPLQKAVRGNTGVLEGIDYRNEEVLAALGYLPNIDLGLVAKIDMAEISKAVTPLRNLFFGVLGLVLGLLLLVFLFSPTLADIKARTQNFFRDHILTKSAIQKIVLGLSGLSLLGTGLVFYNVRKTESRSLDTAKKLAQSLVEEGVDTFNRSLSSIAQLALATAEDLNAGRLLKEDITTSIKRDMNENEELFGMLVVFQDRKVSEYIVRTEKAFEVKPLSEYSTELWYQEPMKSRQGVWLKPELDPSGKKLVVTYSVPFYAQDDEEKATPLGVVAAFYAIDSMKEGASLLTIGQTGYAFVITQDGTFVYHPVKRYIADTTIFSLAEKQGDEALYVVGQAMIQGEKGSKLIPLKESGQNEWIYYQPIPETGWSLGLFFSEQDIEQPALKIHHKHIWLIIVAIITCLLLSILLSGALVPFGLTRLGAFSLLSSLVFAAGLVVLWRQVKEVSSMQALRGAPITNQVGLDSFISEMQDDAVRRYEPTPLIVPTGIFIDSWEFPDAMQIEFSGTIWQKYEKQLHEKIVRDIYLPQSIDRDKELLYDSPIKGSRLIEWHINATLAQQFNYGRYPFDSQRISIILDHKDQKKNVLLVPDVASYDSLNPSDLPGISKSFRFPGYIIDQSFFNFETVKKDTSAEGKEAGSVRLHFNIILTRGLLNALIIYLLPLLVIMFSLFAVFCTSGRVKGEGAPFVPFKTYTALLFALIVLHRTLRSQYPTGDVLYIEYLFFFTYLTILLVIVHGSVLLTRFKIDYVDGVLSPIIKVLFWPVQLALWFITTVIVFYN